MTFRPFRRDANTSQFLSVVIATAALAFGNSGEAKAGTINIINKSSNSSIAKTTWMYFNNVDGASEGLDGIDSPFSTPYSSALIIYSKIPNSGFDPGAGTDARPVNTGGLDFYLAVKGSENGTLGNTLRFAIDDVTNLENKTLTGQVSVR